MDIEIGKPVLREICEISSIQDEIHFLANLDQVSLRSTRDGQGNFDIVDLNRGYRILSRLEDDGNSDIAFRHGEGADGLVIVLLGNDDSDFLAGERRKGLRRIGHGCGDRHRLARFVLAIGMVEGDGGPLHGFGSHGIGRHDGSRGRRGRRG